MTTVTITKIEVALPTVRLEGSSEKRVLDEMVMSDLFNDSERQAIASGMVRLDSDLNLVLGVIVLYGVRPAIERWGERLQDKLFEWEETLISLGADVARAEAIDRKRRALIARVEGTEEGFLEGRQVLVAAAVGLTRRMETGIESVMEESREFHRDRLGAIEETTKRFEVLNDDEIAVTEAFAGAAKRLTEAGKQLEGIEKRLAPALDRAEKALVVIRY